MADVREVTEIRRTPARNRNARNGQSVSRNNPHFTVWGGAFLIAILTSSFAPLPGAKAAIDPPVIVIVDMDSATDGIQSSVRVPPGTLVVPGVAAYIFDPVGDRNVFSIGYAGGIDRGIAFGHVPAVGNAGAVLDLDPFPGTPVNPANGIYFAQPPGLDPGFPGPEVQYVEFGALRPAPISAWPAPPIFTVDVRLQVAAEGDIFDFYLLDYTAVWAGSGAGAFSTRGFITLDTGGDVVPDSTVSLHGIDPDSAVSVPPAAYPVDYVDGGALGGPATIVVTGLTALSDPGAGSSGSHPHGPLLDVRPNPFRAQASIVYDTHEPGPAALVIHDAAGRRVRVLASTALLPAGHHVVRWDGTDERRRPVAAGVYFCRLQSQHSSPPGGAWTRFVRAQ